MQSKRILITGASGLVGTRLTELLTLRGYEVCHLSRGRSNMIKTFQWDVDKQTIERGALDGVDTIVHLAGANVSEKRWTEKRKKVIIDSRVESTKLLAREISQSGNSVRNFISASATGYYGFKHPEKVFTESDAPGRDFLANVTQLWEAAVDKISSPQIRVVKMRIGVVLAKEGGALKPMAIASKWFVGSPLGSGNQFLSWIHIDDLCEMFIKAIEDQNIRGALNAVSPHPVTNRELTQAIAIKLHRPVLLPAVPSFVLRLMFGEMADIVLEGNRASAKKIMESGFVYKFADMQTALDDLLP
jgi:uncharacterized protein (TIGR01777 family)